MNVWAVLRKEMDHFVIEDVFYSEEEAIEYVKTSIETRGDLGMTIELWGV